MITSRNSSRNTTSSLNGGNFREGYYLNSEVASQSVQEKGAIEALAEQLKATRAEAAVVQQKVFEAQNKVKALEEQLQSVPRRKKAGPAGWERHSESRTHNNFLYY